MWKLETDNGKERSYLNSATGTKSTQTLIYKDKDGNKWWSFDDLNAMPWVRKFAANKIISLYALGLSKVDAEMFFTKHKATLKEKDNGEKYEKAFSETLEFENLFKGATDPVKQMSSLTCVYFTLEDENVDSFENGLQIKKMSMLEADGEMHAFFLRRQMDLTERLSLLLSLISQTALQV